MFICTFYHTPVAFCDRGIVFYITKGVSLMRHPLLSYLTIGLPFQVPAVESNSFPFLQNISELFY